MKIYTSYYDNMDNISNVTFIGCGNAPEWYNGVQYKDFKSFRDIIKVIKELKELSEGLDVCLLDDKRIGEARDRQMVIDWFNKNGYCCEELFSQDEDFIGIYCGKVDYAVREDE